MSDDDMEIHDDSERRAAASAAFEFLKGQAPPPGPPPDPRQAIDRQVREELDAGLLVPTQVVEVNGYLMRRGSVLGLVGVDVEEMTLGQANAAAAQRRENPRPGGRSVTEWGQRGWHEA